MSEPWGCVLTRNTVVHLDESRPAVTFGRSAEHEVRIGHVPHLDPLVSRHAGEIRWLDGRLLVTNHAERLTVAVQVPGRPTVDIFPQDSYAVSARTFDILVEATFRHVLRCRILAARPEIPRQERSAGSTSAGAEAVTCLGLPVLTDRQLKMLEYYAEPIRQGGTSGRSHQQVADLLGISRSLARLEMTTVWEAFDRAGVPMRLYDDKRDEVIDAWLRHDLRPSG